MKNILKVYLNFLNKKSIIILIYLFVIIKKNKNFKKIFDFLIKNKINLSYFNWILYYKTFNNKIKTKIKIL